MGTDTRPSARIIGATADAGAAVERALEERGVATETVRSADACLAHLESVGCVVIAGSARDADPVECCRAIRER
ncbi:hypothetical protein, partial [Natrinema soli]